MMALIANDGFQEGIHQEGLESEQPLSHTFCSQILIKNGCCLSSITNKSVFASGYMPRSSLWIKSSLALHLFTEYPV